MAAGTGAKRLFELPGRLREGEVSANGHLPLGDRVDAESECLERHSAPERLSCVAADQTDAEHTHHLIAPAGVERAMSAKTILYVEDNEVNRRLVRDLLKRTSYRLLEAPDGEAGMAIARQEHPDLILMDVQLPRVSGIEATRTLRGEPATADTPIIAITSFALGGDEQKAREAGATAYLAKPFSPRDLLEMIRRLLPEDPGAEG
jgi:two-component system cell cycle response regulator DivK